MLASSNVRTFCDTIPDEISLSTNRVVLKLLVTSVAKAVEGFILEYSSSYEGKKMYFNLKYYNNSFVRLWGPVEYRIG